MTVIEVVKKARWFQYNDVVRINSELGSSIDVTSYMGWGTVTCVKTYTLPANAVLRVKMPKSMHLGVGDFVSSTKFFNLHQDRFTKS